MREGHLATPGAPGPLPQADPPPVGHSEEGGIDIVFNPPPTGGLFMQDDSFVRCIMGPVGSAKSSTCCTEMLRRACETPPGLDGVRRSRGVIIRNTYPELRDTTIKTFKEWVPQQLGKWKVSENTFVIDFVGEDDVPVYCEVLFRALDTPDDVRSLLSLELTFAYINEAREIEKAVLKLLLTRLRRYPSPRSLAPGTVYWSGLWMDTNPPDDDHHLYKRFEEDKPKGNKLFRQPSGRSPEAENLENLKPTGREYYASIVENNKDDPEFIKVYVDAEYGSPKDGKPVYPEFHSHVHVTTDFDANPDLDLIVGMDFGLTPAATLMQRARDGQLQVFDEFVSEDMGARTFADELVKHIKQHYPGRPVRGHGDPAGDERSKLDGVTTCFDVVNAAGLPMHPASTNDPVIRREAVALNLKRMTMLARPGLVVHPRCKTLVKGMNGRYCLRRLQVAGREKYAEKPEKNKYSHVCEALQYACVGEGEDARPVQAASPDAEASRGQRVQLRFKVKRAIGR